MRGTKAKALRRQAKEQSWGKITGYNDIRMGTKPCGFHTSAGGFRVPFMVETYQRRCKPSSFRAIYQALK